MSDLAPEVKPLEWQNFRDEKFTVYQKKKEKNTIDLHKSFCYDSQYIFKYIKHIKIFAIIVVYDVIIC